MSDTDQITCSRCGRAFGEGDSTEEWNTVFKNGYPTGHLCPEHQTAQEWTEAEVNSAFLESTFRPEPGSPEARWALGEVLKRTTVEVINDWVAAYNAGNTDTFDAEELAAELRRRVEKHAGPYNGPQADFVKLIEMAHESLRDVNDEQPDED